MLGMAEPTKQNGEERRARLGAKPSSAAAPDKNVQQERMLTGSLRAGSLHQHFCCATFEVSTPCPRADTSSLLWLSAFWTYRLETMNAQIQEELKALDKRETLRQVPIWFHMRLASWTEIIIPLSIGAPRSALTFYRSVEPIVHVSRPCEPIYRLRQKTPQNECSGDTSQTIFAVGIRLGLFDAWPSIGVTIRLRR